MLLEGEKVRNPNNMYVRTYNLGIISGHVQYVDEMMMKDEIAPHRFLALLHVVVNPQGPKSSFKLNHEIGK